MFCNVALWDRALRFLLALIVLTYAIAGGPYWFYILGLYALGTAAWGICPLYAIFRLKTTR